MRLLRVGEEAVVDFPAGIRPLVEALQPRSLRRLTRFYTSSSGTCGRHKAAELMRLRLRLHLGCGCLDVHRHGLRAAAARLRQRLFRRVLPRVAQLETPHAATIVQIVHGEILQRRSLRSRPLPRWLVRGRRFVARERTLLGALLIVLREHEVVAVAVVFGGVVVKPSCELGLLGRCVRCSVRRQTRSRRGLAGARVHIRGRLSCELPLLDRAAASRAAQLRGHRWTPDPALHELDPTLREPGRDEGRLGSPGASGAAEFGSREMNPSRPTCRMSVKIASQWRQSERQTR